MIFLLSYGWEVFDVVRQKGDADLARGQQTCTSSLYTVYGGLIRTRSGLWGGERR
jgi:hypothetical protein